jgi:hypothetical protein
VNQPAACRVKPKSGLWFYRLRFSFGASATLRMAHYFCFSVEPTLNHPLAGKIHGGWAHVFVRNETEDSEQRARIEVEKMDFLIHKRIHARLVTPERLSLLPKDIQSAFVKNPEEPIYIEIVAYQSGENPKDLGDPFEDEFYNN